MRLRTQKFFSIKVSQLKSQETKGETSMLSNQIVFNESQSSHEKHAYMKRRTFIGGAAAILLQSSGRVMTGEENDGQLHDPFILLLRGLYQPVPVGQGPANNLGLTTVNLSDGSYIKTHIYPVFGIPGGS